MKTIKDWLIRNFLPVWVKETVLRDNRNLQKENEVLRQKIRELESYIKGMKFGLRAVKRRSIKEPEVADNEKL